VTRAKILDQSGGGEAASAAWEAAVERVREHGPQGRLREVLSGWASSLAAQGQHERAYELTREALQAGS
jgi:hypothetical protein